VGPLRNLFITFNQRSNSQAQDNSPILSIPCPSAKTVATEMVREKEMAKTKTGTVSIIWRNLNRANGVSIKFLIKTTVGRTLLNVLLTWINFPFYQNTGILCVYHKFLG